MRISVDISLYPLTEKFEKPILAFIDMLEANRNLTVQRNSLSTQIFGEYRDVMDCLDAEMLAVFDALPNSVFVLKIIGKDRADVVDL